MPSAWWSLCQDIDTYLKDLEEGNRSPSTIKDYRRTLLTLFQGLQDGKMTINPRKVGKKEIRWLMDEYITGANSYKASQIKRLLIFLRWAGNTEVNKLRLGFGYEESSNIKWLSEEEALKLRTESRGIERMIVHCELDLCMRRIELLRLKVGDFKKERFGGSIHIHGKGRNGGKHRNIAWDLDTERILNEYLESYRTQVIARARIRNPTVEVPDNLFIYEKAGKIRAYQKTSIDRFLKDFGQELGINISNHDLRRTGGRLLHRAGVPIEEIAKIFGHRDTKTTLHYLGLDKEDMGKAMQKLAQYRKSLEFPKVEISCDSQLNGGRIGISVQENDWLEYQNFLKWKLIRESTIGREDLR